MGGNSNALVNKLLKKGFFIKALISPCMYTHMYHSREDDDDHDYFGGHVIFFTWPNKVCTTDHYKPTSIIL